MGKDKLKSGKSDFLFDQPRNKYWMKSIREGEDFQAEIPEFVGPPREEESDAKDEQKTLLWSSSSQGDTPDTEVDNYIQWAHMEADSPSSNVAEFAMQVLHLTKGNIAAAISILTTGDGPQLPEGHALRGYTYSESELWDEFETQRFFKSLKENKRKFHLVSRDMQTKTTKQCVNFYHLFKVLYPYRYKLALKMPAEPRQRPRVASIPSSRSSARIAAVRARRAAKLNSGAAKVVDADVPPTGQDDLSQPLDSSCPQLLSANEVEEEMECMDSGDGSVVTEGSGTAQQAGGECCSSGQSLQSDMDKKKKRSTSSPGTPRVKNVRDQTPTLAAVSDHSGEVVFPCVQCGRVFAKVKSRNAHMKYHKIHPTI